MFSGKQFRTIVTLAMPWLLCAALVGCKEMKVAPVSGMVTLDGKPLERASVVFEPQSVGRPSSGVTDKNGKYRLSYSMHEEGAEVGACSVRVSTALEQGDYGSKKAKELVPSRYVKEPLIVEVLSRSNTINIELTTDAK